jgi:hypothetical protein
MSESTGSAATGGDLGSSDPAAGGMPTESDAPELQGLGGAAPDPSDPENGSSASEQAPFDPGAAVGDAAASSDPMPDSSGTAGT